MTVEKRYYDLLGAAYEVPLETARFDAFFDRAMAFFFPEPETSAKGARFRIFRYEMGFAGLIVVMLGRF